MTVYYDKNGKLIGLMRWARLFEDMRYRVIGQSHFENLTVSTVWIGFDMDVFNLMRAEPLPPLIFESMVFEVPQGDDVWRSLEQRRYRTLREARIGHADLCSVVTTMMDIKEEVMSDAGVRDLPDLSTYQEDPADVADDGQGPS